MRTNKKSNNNYNKNRQSNSRNPRPESRPHNFLPSPGILESYEEISEGSVKKIIDMAESEQQHRHSWENKYLKSMSYTTRVGQLLGFALAIIIVYAALVLHSDLNTVLASVVVFSGFGFLMIAALTTASSRKRIDRPQRNFIKR